MVKYIGFLGLFFLSFNIMAHQFSVTGRVIDAKDNSPLIGVNILLTNIKDSTKSIGVSTDIDGKFTITPVDLESMFWM